MCFFNIKKKLLWKNNLFLLFKIKQATTYLTIHITSQDKSSLEWKEMASCWARHTRNEIRSVIVTIKENIFFLNDLNCGGTLLAIFTVMNKRYWNYPLRSETMSFSTVILFWFHSPDGPNVFNWHAAQLAAIPLCKTLCWNLIIKRMFIKLIIACLISNFHMEILD